MKKIGLEKIFVIFAIILLIIQIYSVVVQIKEAKDYAQESLEYISQKKDAEKRIESYMIDAKNIEKSKVYSYSNPYIPQDFKYIEGAWDLRICNRR